MLPGQATGTGDGQHLPPWPEPAGPRESVGVTVLILLRKCAYCGYQFQTPIEARDSAVHCPKCGFVITSEPWTKNQPFTWETRENQASSGAAEASVEATYMYGKSDA